MKIYKSEIRSAIYHVKANGIDVKVKFYDKGEPYCYGVYRCNDKDVCKAIEALPDFGNVISILKEEKEEEPAVAKTYDKVYADVKRTQDANKILVSEYGIDKATLNSKADALNAAEKLNISFPNL